MSRKLHIGGVSRVAGWEILNIQPDSYVDHVGNAKDLSIFADNTFDTLYASHVLEHFDYNGELGTVLREWKRVLQPGGTLYVSVPDMDVLADLFLRKSELNPDERFAVMRMMFGGHINEHDHHAVGLNQEFLTHYLCKTGFENIKRLDEFGIFNDTSSLQFKGVRISLNMIASKPG